MNHGIFKASLTVRSTWLWNGTAVSKMNRCPLHTDNEQLSTVHFTSEGCPVCFAWKSKNVILSTFCSLSKPHFWKASKWNCNILQSSTSLTLWKTFKSSANKTKLDLQTESQTASVQTLHSNGFMIMPWGTLEFNVG
jgi:hypothetical protein